MNTPLNEPVLLHASGGSPRGRVRISELFVSRQGEGVLAGTPSQFIRLSGCNLRCWFCDTPYASWQPEKKWTTVDAIVTEAIGSGVHHAVITGGEPMLQPVVVPLSEQLREAGIHITIETAGTFDRPVACDLMSISPKLAGSGPRQGDPGGPRWRLQHERLRWQPDVILRLLRRAATYQLKFVVDRPADLEAIEECVGELPGVDRSRVMIMPQAIDLPALDAQAAWLQPATERAGFLYCDRMHLRWYGNRRGT